MCGEKEENIYFSYTAAILKSHSQGGTRDRLRCRMAWQEIRQVRIKKVVLEKADLAVVTVAVKGGKTRSVPVKNKKKKITHAGMGNRGCIYKLWLSKNISTFQNKMFFM